LQIAALAPDRITGLALLSSAPFTPLTAASQDLPMPAWAYQALFSSDFPIRAIIGLAPGLLDPVFDVTPALRAALSPEDEAMVAALVQGFLPVTLRLPGLANPTIVSPQRRGCQPVTSPKISTSRAASARRFSSTPPSQASLSSGALFVFGAFAMAISI
jgi:pimeloyl-ACP methyl ester carboxylesterase